VTLFRTRAGEGTPVVLLHGLTATSKYVVMGSRALERSGHDVLAYDARGHGASDPAPSPEAYTYEDLAADLVALLDEEGIDRAVLAGASMGAHTALRVALDHPERVAGLVVITPAYDPEDWPGDLVRWDALSEGLRSGGVEGFVAAYGETRDMLRKVLQQRLAAHEHPGAVADALKAVPRSRPWETREQLAQIAVPTVVVADRDELDPGHPLAVGELYAELIPGARLVVEAEGESPIAWRGGTLSKVIAELAAEATGSAAA
jgi:pimeloyl-ACP methyl ester carboxylesterase